MMTGYKRGDAKQRGAAALSAPPPRSASDEFRETNFEYAIQSFTPAQSSGSQSSEFERISQPSIYSESEARESAFGNGAKEEFGRRRVDENFDRGEAFGGERSGAGTVRIPRRCSGPCFCMYCQMERECAMPSNTPAQSVKSQRNASTQTDASPRVDSDQIFASLVPRYATGLLGVGQRHYGPVGIFTVFFFFIWRYVMNQGSHYYVRMEIGGYGMDPS